MDIQSIRGTHDLLPGTVELWQRIESTAREVFELYGFAEIRTPVLEETELFARSIGTETDIVQKEMYSLSDSRGKSITLRPEGTAPVVRSYVENGLFKRGEAVKLFYIGPMFRHERPQKGRYRQFHQIGAEVLGTDHPAVEAEAIHMLKRFFSELGLVDYSLLVNSVGCPSCRPPYVRALREALREQQAKLCPQCLRRMETNPLRVFDCKEEGCQPVIDALPRIPDSLCRECDEHYTRFLQYVSDQEISFRKEPRLVRGLDYYVRTTFEIVSDLLGPTQNAIVGGGRYDGLSEAIGGPPAKGFGFALGLERFVLLLSGRDQIQDAYKPPEPMLFLAYLDEHSFREALRLTSELRSHNISTYIDFQERSLKAQLRLANRLQSRFSCTVGEEEIRSDRFPLKRMSNGELVVMDRQRLVEYLIRQAE